VQASLDHSHRLKHLTPMGIKS